MSDAQLQRVVVAQAQALSVSCESNISPSLAALLQSRLSLSEAQLWKVLVALPCRCHAAAFVALRKIKVLSYEDKFILRR